MFTSPFQICKGEELILPLPIATALLGNGFHLPPGIKTDGSFSFFFSLLLPSVYHVYHMRAESVRAVALLHKLPVRIMNSAYHPAVLLNPLPEDINKQWCFQCCHRACKKDIKFCKSSPMLVLLCGCWLSAAFHTHRLPCFTASPHLSPLQVLEDCLTARPSLFICPLWLCPAQPHCVRKHLFSGSAEQDRAGIA